MKHAKYIRISAGFLMACCVVVGRVASAAGSDSITIQGSQAAVNDISIASQSGYNNLDLTSGETAKTVAIVNEKSNDPDGYTVTLQSANALDAESSQAHLKGANGSNSTTVNYSIKYGPGGSEADVTLNGTGAAVVTDANSNTGSSGSDKNLKVTLSGSAWRPADTYSDTLTVTIAAK